MSLRKGGRVISTSNSPSAVSQAKPENVSVPGVRPSPLDGRPTTSTGTASLDTLLAGHSGLPMGTSLLIEEHGTTDFAGILLRYYAAEGLVQGHQVHVLGMHEGWKTELPGILTDSKKPSSKSESAGGDKMKIAWRYESLGSVGTPRGPYFSTNNSHHSLTRRQKHNKSRLDLPVAPPPCSVTHLILRNGSPRATSRVRLGFIPQ